MGGFKLAPGIAEKLLHGSDVQPAADLIPASDGVLAGGCEQTASFEAAY